MLTTKTLQNTSVVYVIDNDKTIRESFSLLLGENGYVVSCHENAECFLNSLGVTKQPSLSCAILDVNLSNLSGIDLQRMLIDKGISLPLAFVTGHSEVSTAVEALKPIEKDALCNLVAELLSKAHLDRQKFTEANAMKALFSTLTTREIQILELVVAGKSNKIIGLELNISIKTVEQHRSNIMEKLKVKRPSGLLHLVYKYQKTLPHINTTNKDCASLKYWKN
jgi:FixJ family two-component response regulator